MSLRQLPDFVSESESSEGDENSYPETFHKKFTRQTYSQHLIFSSKLEATSFVKAEKIWTQRTTDRRGDNGTRIYYDCKMQRSCPCKLYLCLDPSSQNVSLFLTESEHNHAEKVVGLSEVMKTEVRNVFDLGIRTPHMILKALAEKQLDLPEKTKLCNFLKTLRLSKGDS